MARRWNPWHDVFAFLLLASATLVIVIVLRVTQHYYGQFGAAGRALAWGASIMGILALAGLAWIVLRLYVQPFLVNGRNRLAAAGSRKRNP